VSRSGKCLGIGSGGRDWGSGIKGFCLRDASGGDDQIYVHNVVTSMSMNM